jgi:hypothetical protein
LNIYKSHTHINAYRSASQYVTALIRIPVGIRRIIFLVALYKYYVVQLLSPLLIPSLAELVRPLCPPIIIATCLSSIILIHIHLMSMIMPFLTLKRNLVSECYVMLLGTLLNSLALAIPSIHTEISIILLSSFNMNLLLLQCAVVIIKSIILTGIGAFTLWLFFALS